MMKLFVWREFETDYHDGLAFALAETEEEAKELVRNGGNYSYEPQWGDVEVHPIQKYGYGITGGS